MCALASGSCCSLALGAEIWDVEGREGTRVAVIGYEEGWWGELVSRTQVHIEAGSARSHFPPLGRHIIIITRTCIYLLKHHIHISRCIFHILLIGTFFSNLISSEPSLHRALSL
jgi:hypothetical protein